MTTTTLFTPEYLGRLANIETPEEMPDGLYLDVWHSQISDFQMFCHDYCEIRNAAKDLLRNPQNKGVEERLSELVVKLKIGFGN